MHQADPDDLDAPDDLHICPQCGAPFRTQTDILDQPYCSEWCIQEAIDEEKKLSRRVTK